MRLQSFIRDAYRFISLLVLLLVPVISWADNPIAPPAASTPATLPSNAGMPAPSTPVAVSADTAAFVAKINPLYYNYKRMGLKSFHSEVKINLFDNALKAFYANLKGDNASKIDAIKDVRFYADYSPEKGFKLSYVNYKPTGDANVDANMAKILGGCQKVVNGFWTTWSAMTFAPAIDNAKNSVTIKKTADGYEVDETKDDNITQNFMDSNLLISEADSLKKSSPGAAATLKLLFLKTPDGLLINSIKGNVPQMTAFTIDIAYTDAQKYKMPSTASYSVQMMSNNMSINIEMQFLNWQVN
jgi:hypothetical protein